MPSELRANIDFNRKLFADLTGEVSKIKKEMDQINVDYDAMLKQYDDLLKNHVAVPCDK